MSFITTLIACAWLLSVASYLVKSDYNLETISIKPSNGLNRITSPVPDDCLHCICVVESGCIMPNPPCQMDVGSLSCGPYQIKEDYWNDAKQKGGDLDGDYNLETISIKPSNGLNRITSPVPDDCLHCICVVESGCIMPNPPCQMDVGSLSCGPYQIKEDYWNDAKQKGGDLDGDWKKCSSTFSCSERAVQGYMMRYAIRSRLGHDPACEDFARIHNGGPNGYKNSKTLEYWHKVQACLTK